MGAVKMKAKSTRSVRSNIVSIFVGVALLGLGWAIVPSFAHPHGFLVFTTANCTGTGVPKAKWSDVLASKPPYLWFINLSEGLTCYFIP